jgi:hypothetical protein
MYRYALSIDFYSVRIIIIIIIWAIFLVK